MANNITAIVRAVRDPERKTDKFVTMRGVIKKSSQNDEDIFLDVSFFNGLGKVVEQYVKKGSQIFVSGSLGMRMFNDKQYLSITANNMSFIGGDNQQQKQESDEPAPKKSRKSKQEEVITEEDVPF